MFVMEVVNVVFAINTWTCLGRTYIWLQHYSLFETVLNLRIIPTNMTTSHKQPYIQCQATVLHSFTRTHTHTQFCLCSSSRIFTSTLPISHVHTCTLRDSFPYKYSSRRSCTQAHVHLHRPTHVHTFCQFCAETGVLPAMLLWFGDNRKLQSQHFSLSFP